ncbi:unnamed protein product [Agarophyton chilense]|eukprot:gb/GEZJ01007309.1/.p1 GENE.gb/GEZJ01007309.1/~~gb/GEZJ01007309.1/.p1  ORF type:complete len:185 (+),score=32.92 gb/GEZJ01007309.1/:409-963(+)
MNKMSDDIISILTNLELPEFEFVFAEQQRNSAFRFCIEEGNNFDRTLTVDKQALEDLNLTRLLTWRRQLTWSSFMHGMALHISLRQVREGKFSVETYDDDCVASSFIVKTCVGGDMTDVIMSLALDDASRNGVPLEDVYLRRTLSAPCTPGERVERGGVAVLVLKNAIMVTTVVGRTTNAVGRR